jgi:hypothetical protein
MSMFRWGDFKTYFNPRHVFRHRHPIVQDYLDVVAHGSLQNRSALEALEKSSRASLMCLFGDNDLVVTVRV